MTIAEFLLARITEDEEAAQAAAEAARTAPSNDLSDRWEAMVVHSDSGKPFGVIAGAPVQATRPTAFAHTVEHIARHDPARVLADCEAKRRIVEELALPYIAERRRLMNGQPSWEDEHPDLLRLLALPYADHPDYREEWRSA